MVFGHEASDPVTFLQVQLPRLTPTDMSNLAYCSSGRLLYISKYMKQKRQAISPSAVKGIYEHDVAKKLTDILNVTWRAAPTPEALSVNDEDIEIALRESDDLINENFPQFSIDIRRYRPELNYRLKIWLKQTITLLLHETKIGLSFDAAISTVLPWRVEDQLFSRKLGLFGRADRIYNNRYSLKPEDIKTHNTRFSTLLQGESYRIQLLSYSIMCEEKYHMPSTENRIFFSSDLTYLEYVVTPDSRTELENMVLRARAILSNDTLPPILHGVETIKCNYCFMRQLCHQLEQNQNVQDDWLNRLISKSESDCTRDSLFGSI